MATRARPLPTGTTMPRSAPRYEAPATTPAPPARPAHGVMAIQRLKTVLSRLDEKIAAARAQRQLAEEQLTRLERIRDTLPLTQ
ncbi:MAG: hypothetical protein U0637_08935 [Phycisphaerales bacterium]